MRQQNRRGSLTVVGTGIRTVGQMTTEAIAVIREADEVLHVVADPIAEEMIQHLNPNAQSLQGYYAEGKQRLDTYHEMVDHILSRVRAGNWVCGAFYGHPGVFAYPSHESIRRARREGFEAKMLPGVSAEDCLFADLGVDPAFGGCQSFEATDFLMNGRMVDPSANLILWQVGALGDWTYHSTAYDLRALPFLLQRLMELYPADHEIVVYEAAIFPGCEPVIRRIPLWYLNASVVTPSSTVYLAPCRATTLDPRFFHLLPSPAQA